jgi:hypothetical protein
MRVETMTYTNNMNNLNPDPQAQQLSFTTHDLLYGGTLHTSCTRAARAGRDAETKTRRQLAQPGAAAAPPWSPT